MEKSITPLLVNQLRKPGSEKPLEVRVRVRLLETCPCCGFGRLHRHESMERRRVLHTLVAGRWVYLSWAPLRLRCPACGKTFTCSPEGVRRWARLTDEAVEMLVLYSRRLNYGSAAELLGLNRQRVRRILMKRVGEGIMPEVGEPVVLTLDELSFRKQDFMCLAGELAPTKRPLTLLDNDQVRTIEEYLRSLRNSGVVVEAFVIDMKDAWRKAMKRVFPDAKVIVDPFHVVQDANRRLDAARLVEQDGSGYAIPRYPLLKPRENLTPKQAAQLEWVRRKFPDLFELYLLKEDLRKIICLDSEDKARQEISRWLINAESAANAEGRVWANTIRSWRQELLNLAYYTGQGRRYTNGYIEGKITLVKMIKRLGFGFRSRESFRKKVFVGCCSHDQIPQLLT